MICHGGGVHYVHDVFVNLNRKHFCNQDKRRGKKKRGTAKQFSLEWDKAEEGIVYKAKYHS